MIADGSGKLEIDISQIPDEGLILEREDNPSLYEFKEKGFSVADRVSLRCRIMKTPKGAFVEGHVSTVLKLDCGRCLLSFSKKIRSKISANFSPNPEEVSECHEVELSPEDLDTYYYEDNKIDLRGPVRDCVVLSIPIKLLCKSDCKGLCPVCGGNLNNYQCDCEIEKDIDPRLSVLKNLIKEKE